jgi:two-component system sensor histidine kinase KdpD
MALAAVGVPLLTLGCLAARPALSLTSVLFVFLLLVIGVALVGGLWPALAAAAFGGLAENWSFVAPTHRLTVDRVDDVVALLGGLVVAVAVATVVDRSARRASAAERSRAETAVLASVSRSVLAGDRGVPALLEEIRAAFGLEAVALVERSAGGGERVVDSTGPTGAGGGAHALAVTDTLALRLSGRPLPAAERRVLQALAEQAVLALQRRRLAAAAAEADRLAAGNAMRTALLAAVSHDLRTPLAGIKAASSALRSCDLVLTEADRAELVATIDESADRLTGLVDNLLDMSRLQAGAVSPALSAADVPSVVHAALSWLDAGQRRRVRLEWSDDVPAALADPHLLERVVANLVGNATEHVPSGPVTVSAADGDGRVRVRVVDSGPGVAAADRERVFAPFQRLGDAPAGQGVGLGLAVARGLTEAMGGTLTAADTPGGGLTMVLELPAAELPAADGPR